MQKKTKKMVGFAFTLDRKNKILTHQQANYKRSHLMSERYDSVDYDV